MSSSSARKRTKRRISPIASRGVWPASTRSVTTMAPALMKGLRGRPCSCSSWTIELKADARGLAARPGVQRLSPCLPSASVSRNTLEMLWIENGTSASPAAWTAPSRVGDREAEAARVDPGELRDVVGDLALAEARRELGVDRRRRSPAGRRSLGRPAWSLLPAAHASARRPPAESSRSAGVIGRADRRAAPAARPGRDGEPADAGADRRGAARSSRTWRARHGVERRRRPRRCSRRSSPAAAPRRSSTSPSSAAWASGRAAAWSWSATCSTTR